MPSAALTAGSAYVAVKPSFVGFSKQIGSQATTAGKAAGSKLGTAYGAAAKDAAGPSLRKLGAEVGKARDAEATAAGKVKVAEQQLAAARSKAEGAAKSLGTAEKNLDQARKSGDPEKIARAEKAVDSARSRSLSATTGQTRATESLGKANRDLASAQDRTKGSVESYKSAQDRAGTSMDDTARKSGRLRGAMGSLKSSVGGFAREWGALGALAAGAGLAKLMGSSIKAASDAQQSMGATESVFGKAADSVIKKSNGAATAYGLSANQYRESANLIGSLFKNQGVATDQLAGKTDSMVKLGGDLAATFGGTTKEAVEALGSAFKGEFDPLEKYGVSLKESTVSSEAMRLANVKSKKEWDGLTTAQQSAYKQQATTALIMKQSTSAAGAFGRESNTLADQQQRLAAQWENLKSSLGTMFLPVLTKVVGFLAGDALTAVKNFGGGAKQLFDVLFKGDFTGGPFQEDSPVIDFFFRLRESVGPALGTVLSGIKEVFNILFKGDFTGKGPWAEDSKIVDFLFRIREELQKIPGYIGTAAGWFTTLGAKVWSLRAFLVPLIAAYAGYRLGLALSAAAQKLHVMWTTIQTTWTNRQTIAQTLLNRAMMMNPIGLVVAALVALGAGLVIAYKKSETFRNIVQGAWSGIKAVAGAVVGWFQNTVWPVMRNIFGWIGDKATWLYKNAVLPAWNGIKTGASAVVGWFQSTGWPAMQSVFQWIGDKAMWLWRNGIAPAFAGIKLVVSTVFSWLRDTGWPLFKTVMGWIGSTVSWLWRNVFSPTFNLIKTLVSAVFSFFKNVVWPVAKWFFTVVANIVKWLWNNVVSPYFGLIRGIVTTVFNVFKNVVWPVAKWFFTVVGNIVKLLWSGFFKPAFESIKRLVGAVFGWFRDTAWPIVRTVFGWIGDKAKWLNNNVFQPVFSGIKKVVGGVAAWFRDTVWPIFRNVFTWIGNKAKWVYDTLLKPTFDNMKSGINKVKDTFQTAGAMIGRVFDKLKGWVWTPVDVILNGIVGKSMIGSLRKIPGVDKIIPPFPYIKRPYWAGGWTGPGGKYDPAGVVHADEFVVQKASRRSIEQSAPGYLDALNRFGARALSGMAGYATGGRVKGYANGGRATGGGGHTWPQIWNYVRTRFPGVSKTSDFRPGAVSRAGPPSSHSFGTAIDIDGPASLLKQVMSHMAAKFGSSMRDLIYTPLWGKRMIYQGRWINAPAVTVADHGNHGHIGLMPGKTLSGGAAMGGSGDAGGFGFDLLSPVIDGAKGLLDGALKKFAGGPEATWARMPVELVKSSLSGIRDFVSSKLPWSDPAGVGTLAPGAGVQVWTATVQKALTMLGLPLSLTQATLRRMNQESSGNPRAINNSDSNARRGDPSRGLMQVIGCVPLSTLILTRRGWLRHDEVVEGDETIGFNHETGRSEWTRITRVVHYDDAEVWRIGNSQWHADVTPEHRWVVERDRDLVAESLVCPACGSEWGTRRGMETHLGKAHKMRQPTMRVVESGFARTDELRWGSLRVSAPAETGDALPLTPDECAILAWIQGDGTLRPAVGATGNDLGWDASIYQSKPDMVEKIRKLLASVPHSEHVRKPRENDSWPSFVWNLRRAYVSDLISRSELTADVEHWVTRMSQSQREAWLAAMIDAEGHTADGFTRITQVDGPMQDAIRMAVYLSGHRPTFSRLGAEGRGYKPSGHVGMARPRVAVSMLHEPEVLDRQPVWCVETELGSWTMRQGRRVTLTGNSTFRAYAMPGYSTNIWDPLSNILASLRYVTMDPKYGRQGAASVLRAYNRPGGYASGTLSAQPGLAWVGEQGPELVRFRGGERVYDARESRQIAARDDLPPIQIYGVPMDQTGAVAEEMLFALRRTGRGRYPLMA